MASIPLMLALALLAAPPKGKTSMFRGAYDEPKDEKHKPLKERLQKIQILERFTGSAASLRLPKPLLVKFAGCDGTSNAWYEPTDGTVTFCYEYVAELDATSKTAAEKGIDADVAWEGSVSFILLHETAHALFHLLQVPILGREEDAADQVAAFLLLRAGPAISRRVLTGAAWMYLHDSKGRMPDESDFADVHGLDSQRFYNVLCMAYGSNHEAYKGMIEKKYLPKDRAEGCTEEYQQVGFAVKKLIDPSVDVQLAAKIRAARRERWEGAQTGSDAPAK